jgi:hypothetical protein
MLGSRLNFSHLRRFSTIDVNPTLHNSSISVNPTLHKDVNPTFNARTVDPAEIGRFTNMANEWLDENGPMKILHAFNRVRVPWIVGEMKKV